MSNTTDLLALLADIDRWRKTTSLPLKVKGWGGLAAFDQWNKDLWRRFNAAMAAPNSDLTDATRFRALVEHGRCNEKNGHGLVLGDKLKAKFAFRYWCNEEELLSYIDSLIQQKETP